MHEIKIQDHSSMFEKLPLAILATNHILKLYNAKYIQTKATAILATL